MTKYDGINKVGVTVSAETAVARPSAARRGGSANGFFAAAAILAAVFACKAAPHKIAREAVDAIRSAVRYDMDARADKKLGEIRLVGLIAEAADENTG
jgi:hypothetical protein